MRVKICGITRVSDAQVASRLGVDAIGLVFYAKSPRYLEDLAYARDIALAAGPFVSVVGLFVNPESAYVEQVVRQVPVSILQFHGDEDSVFCAQFSRPFIKAIRMKPELDLVTVASRYASANGILLDAYRPGVPGGTGEVFDWQRLDALLVDGALVSDATEQQISDGTKQRVSDASKQMTCPVILAGGLTPTNVTKAIEIVRPWAVDVSGGVESCPGVKDEEKVAAFMAATAQSAKA